MWSLSWWYGQLAQELWGRAGGVCLCSRALGLLLNPFKTKVVWIDVDELVPSIISNVTTRDVSLHVTLVYFTMSKMKQLFNAVIALSHGNGQGAEGKIFPEVASLPVASDLCDTNLNASISGMPFVTPPTAVTGNHSHDTSVEHLATM